MKKRFFLFQAMFFSLVSCQFALDVDGKKENATGLVTPYSNMDDLSVARSVTSLEVHK